MNSTNYLSDMASNYSPTKEPFGVRRKTMDMMATARETHFKTPKNRTLKKAYLLQGNTNSLHKQQSFGFAPPEDLFGSRRKTINGGSPGVRFDLSPSEKLRDI
jgi:hypothetical protein